MVQPNYGYAKRQREIAKKQAKEEKLKRKNTPPADNPSLNEPAAPLPAPDSDQTLS